MGGSFKSSGIPQIGGRGIMLVLGDGTESRPATIISHKISINDQKNQYCRKKICMNKDSIRKNVWHSRKKSVFRLILGGKICILPNFKVKKSVYTDQI